jgi:hypothetical protein
MPFEANGRAAIERVVEEDPAAFLRIIATLIPKEVKSPSSPLDTLTAEELEMLGEPLVAPWLAATQRNRRSFTPAEGRYSSAHTATRPQTLLNRRTGPLIMSVKLPQHAAVKAAGGHASERRADLAQAARSDSVLRLLSTGASIILDAALNRCGCHSLAGFDALKPGGLLVVADHSARSEDDATVGKTLHRIAEKTLRDEIERAGFAFVADADFLRHPEDTRTNIVFKNPTPNDEFVLKFRKP